ncbi:hypothetical protein BH23ACT5_BH23ACT5_20550 [soil metagenome]
MTVAHRRSHLPTLAAGTVPQLLWLAAVVVLVVVGALGMAAAYRQPSLIAIPLFVELIDALGVSERLALTISFTLPIVSSLAWVLVVLVARRDDGMALLFSVAFLGIFVFASGSPGAVRATIPVLSPVALAAELIALQSLAFLLYLFPNGRFQPRWTRFVLFPCALMLAAYPPMATAIRLIAVEPEAMPPWLVAATLIVTVFTIGGAAVGQTLRYRHHASAVERQQMRWVLLGLSALVAPATLMTVGMSLSPGPWVGWVILGAAMAGPVAPLTAGVAIFRYRLYDIDLVVKRTLVYATLTGVLALVYVASGVGISQLTSTDSDLATAAATLAVAALFSPARKRIQGIVDARFYRSRYDPQGTLEAFSSRLRRQVDLAKVESALTSVVQRSLQPQQLSFWLATSESRRPPPTASPPRSTT